MNDVVVVLFCASLMTGKMCREEKRKKGGRGRLKRARSEKM